MSLKSHQRNWWSADEHKHSLYDTGSPCPAGWYGWQDVLGSISKYLYHLRNFPALNIPLGIYFCVIIRRAEMAFDPSWYNFHILRDLANTQWVSFKKRQKFPVDALSCHVPCLLFLPGLWLCWASSLWCVCCHLNPNLTQSPPSMGKETDAQWE